MDVQVDEQAAPSDKGGQEGPVEEGEDDLLDDAEGAVNADGHRVHEVDVESDMHRFLDEDDGGGVDHTEEQSV